MSLKIIRNDILKEKADAIVTPASRNPRIDGTTLVRTSDGGTIAVAETFEEAMTIWGNC